MAAPSDLPRDAGAVPNARFTVRVAGVDGGFLCRPDQRVLEAMAGTLFGGGSSRPDIKIGCRRGGCGICRVRVLAGSYEVTVMSAAFVSQREQGEGFALACCLYPRSDLVVEAARRPRLPPQGATASVAQSSGPHIGPAQTLRE